MTERINAIRMVDFGKLHSRYCYYITPMMELYVPDGTLFLNKNNISSLLQEGKTYELSHPVEVDEIGLNLCCGEDFVERFIEEYRVTIKNVTNQRLLLIVGG